MMNLEKGVVTLSFDCEAKWGMADLDLDWKNQLTDKNLTEAYEYILDTLKKYNIPSSFAFVGGMTETKDNFLNKTEQLLNNKNHEKWLAPVFKAAQNNDEGWFLPHILDLCRRDEIHEIASHGYTHIPFGTLSIEELNLEMQLIQDWSKSKEINCKTIIYPRNEIRFNELLINYDIHLYRNSPKLFHKKYFPKYINTFFEELNIFKKSELLNLSKGLPGGVFINWKYGPRRLIPNSISSIRYESILNDAVRKKNVAHFWTHPHNFITAPESRRIFEKLCKSIERKVNANQLIVKRQVDFI